MKMRKFSKLARSTRSHIHRLFSMLVFCRYTVIYSAIPQVIKGNCIDCICIQMYFETWKNMFLRQSIWSTNKILKEIVLEYENAKKFPRSQIVGILSSIAPYHKYGNKRELALVVYIYRCILRPEKIYMFLRRSLVILSFIVPYHK